MPPKASPHFLGLQLSVDFLRAAIVDEQLEPIGSEQVEFDVEFPDYQTRGGLYASSGDVYTTSVELWLKALDLLFDRLQKKYDLSKIKAVSGACQLAPVCLTQDATQVIQNLSAESSLRDQIAPNCIALAHPPAAQDMSAAPHAASLESTLGGPESMAARVGIASHASLLAAQLLCLRITKPDVWAKTSKIMPATSFLCSIMSGEWVPLTESEAALTGMYSLAKDKWDDAVLQILAGPNDGPEKMKALLGSVERNNLRAVGRLSPYFIKKYGLDADAVVYPFTPEYLASYLSLCPSSADCVVDFGSTDVLLTPTTKLQPSPFFVTIPHPVQDAAEKNRKFISLIFSRNADVPRALVRDMYTKSWSAFDRLVAVVPPGGSIGLDDKLFSFWLLQDEGHPFSHIKGIYRFETGIKVGEFRDLRANPRCLLESQILSLRVRLAHLTAAGIFLPSRTTKMPRSNQVVDSLGVKFDPYDTTNLPRRILATGSASTFPSVVGLLGDVFNAPVLIPNSSIESSAASNKEASQTNSPSTSSTSANTGPSRAALGAAYVARWGWRKASRPDEKHASFEDEIRWIMTKKWTVAGNGPATGAGNRSRSVSAPGTAPGGGSYMHHQIHSKSGLASSSFAEEDEDEESYESSFGQYSGAVTPPRNAKALATANSSIGTPAGSISGSSAAHMILSSSASPNLAFDITEQGSNGLLAGITGANPNSHPPMAPIQPLPTDDADVQLGLVKVAEPDHDTFLTYAAIVPEFCRLERMVVKGLV